MAITTTVDMDAVKLQIVDTKFLYELALHAIADQFASISKKGAKGSWRLSIFNNMAVSETAKGEAPLLAAELQKQEAGAVEFNPVKETDGVSFTEETEIVTDGQINVAAAGNVGRTAGRVKGRRATQALDLNTASAGGFAIQADSGLVIDTGAIDIDDITDTDIFTAALGKKARQQLVNNDAEEFDGQFFFALAHNDVIEDLQDDAKWIDAKKYADPQALIKGEVGALNGIRYVKNQQATITANVGTVDTYQTHIFGVNAYGKADDKQETLIANPIPTDLSGSQFYAAYKMFFEYKIVLRPAMITVISAAS
jgi:uncharacterized protein YunC (DUF1805 family)